MSSSGPSTAVPPAGYTMLKLKRKRNEEPLAALVVEAEGRRKRVKDAPSIFQYAETVEDAAWNSEQEQKAIQDRISRLAKECSTRAPAVTQTSDRPQESPVASRPHEGAGRRYTIRQAELPAASPQQATVAPAQASAKEPTPGFQMYDAVPSAPKEEVPLDPEMEKFHTMLKAYLTVNDVDIRPQPSAQPGSLSVDSNMASPNTEEGDYVWDVFYLRPATLTEWNEIAANAGTVSGWPPPNNESYSSDSEDSEIVDEADEDSNEEDYYRNDYPDEDDDSDEWHENSDYEELETGREWDPDSYR